MYVGFTSLFVSFVRSFVHSFLQLVASLPFRLYCFPPLFASYTVSSFVDVKVVRNVFEWLSLGLLRSTVLPAPVKASTTARLKRTGRLIAPATLP